MTRFTYNGFGQIETRELVNTPSSYLTRYDYYESGESEGYLKQVTVDPDGIGSTARYETDARGNVAAAIDSRGVRHESDFNELDWLVGGTDRSDSTHRRVWSPGPEPRDDVRLRRRMETSRRRGCLSVRPEPSRPA